MRDAPKRELTPAEREVRVKGAAARHSLDTYINSIVRRAPELTVEQIEKLRPLLAGAAVRR